MSDSTTNLDLISSGQAQKEITANALFDAFSVAGLYGRRLNTTSALTWGYFGGVLAGASGRTANGTLTLTASTTNYIEADETTGALSVNTTGWTVSGKIKVYKVITGASAVTSYEDWRPIAMKAGATYTLPTATDTVLGGVKVGSGLAITSGVLSVSYSYTLPTATDTILGGVKVDGTTITADVNGVISAIGGTGGYILPTATDTVLGGIKVGSGLAITSGVLSVSGSSFAEVIADTTTAKTIALTDVGKYLRFTNTEAKTVTFSSAVTFVAGQEYIINNRAATGDLTIVGTGITLNVPKLGTLILEPKDFVTVKFISATEADIIGSTKAA